MVSINPLGFQHSCICSCVFCVYFTQSMHVSKISKHLTKFVFMFNLLVHEQAPYLYAGKCAYMCDSMHALMHSFKYMISCSITSMLSAMMYECAVYLDAFRFICLVFDLHMPWRWEWPQGSHLSNKYLAAVRSPLPPIREYNGLKGENRGSFKGQHASSSNLVMFWVTLCFFAIDAIKNILNFWTLNKLDAHYKTGIQVVLNSTIVESQNVRI